MNPNDLKRVIEALIFAADAPLTPERIRETLEACTDEEIAHNVETLNGEYEAAGHSFMIRQVAGGYQVTTRPEFGNWIKKLYLGRQKGRLSQAGLESLAIIAFKQPISRVDIAQIRGVNSDAVIGTLLERKLVTISGRSEAVGRPLLYSTTPEFLEFFGINDLAELPKPREIEELIGKEGMPEEVLQALSSDKQLKLPISFEPEAGAEQLTASNLVAPLMPLGIARPESNEPQEAEGVAPRDEATTPVVSSEEVEVENVALSSSEEEESEIENAAVSSIETEHDEAQHAAPAFIQTKDDEAESVSPSLIETEKGELQFTAPSFIQPKDDKAENVSSSIIETTEDELQSAASSFMRAEEDGVQNADPSFDQTKEDEAETVAESLHDAHDPEANLIEPVTVVSQAEVAHYVPQAETPRESITVVPEETSSTTPVKKAKERKRGKRGAQLAEDNNGRAEEALPTSGSTASTEVESNDNSQTENLVAASMTAASESDYAAQASLPGEEVSAFSFSPLTAEREAENIFEEEARELAQVELETSAPELVTQAFLPANESSAFSSSSLNAELEAGNIFEEETHELAQIKFEASAPEVIAVSETEIELDSVVIDEEELADEAELEAGFNQKEANAFFVDKKNEPENFMEAAPVDEEASRVEAFEAQSEPMRAVEPTIVAEETSAAFLSEPVENVTAVSASEELSQPVWAKTPVAVDEEELRAEMNVLESSQAELEVDTWPEVTEVRIEEASAPALEMIVMPVEIFSQKENGKEEAAPLEFEKETARLADGVATATSMAEPAYEEGADFFV